MYNEQSYIPFTDISQLLTFYHIFSRIIFTLLYVFILSPIIIIIIINFLRAEAFESK